MYRNTLDIHCKHTTSHIHDDVYVYVTTVGEFTVGEFLLTNWLVNQVPSLCDLSTCDSATAATATSAKKSKLEEAMEPIIVDKAWEEMQSQRLTV